MLRRSERADLGIEQPRPFTPDDITDEMVERYWAAMKNPVSNYDEAVRRALAAALTEPPTRPEGAEELDPIVDEFLTSYWRGDIDGADATDWLAERGVRVTGEPS